MRSGTAVDMGWWCDEFGHRSVRLSWAAGLDVLYLFHARTKDYEILAWIEEPRMRELFGNWSDHSATEGVGWIRDLAAAA